MSIEIKQKIKEVADDFGMPAKSLIEIVGKFYDKPKSSSQNLTEDQLNVIFDYITAQNQIGSIAEVFAAAKPKEEPKAEAPAAPAPEKPSAPQQNAQQQKPQSAPQFRPNTNRPGQNNNNQRPQQNTRPQAQQNQPRPQNASQQTAAPQQNAQPQTAQQPKQPQPERILSVGRLRDHVIRPHGGQKAEHGALRIAALRRQLLERQRLFRPAQKLQQLHRLRNRQYDISIHHGARPLLPSA